MNTNDLDFDLPEELIAQTLLKNEMPLNSWSSIEKQGNSRPSFDAILDELEPGDTLVINNTRVHHQPAFMSQTRNG